MTDQDLVSVSQLSLINQKLKPSELMWAPGLQELMSPHPHWWSPFFFLLPGDENLLLLLLPLHQRWQDSSGETGAQMSEHQRALRVLACRREETTDRKRQH